LDSLLRSLEMNFVPRPVPEQDRIMRINRLDNTTQNTGRQKLLLEYVVHKTI